jgi:hypothetical protein
MREKDTDLLGDLRTQSVFDSQSMLVHHIVVDVESVVKQAFGEAVAADCLRGARLAEAGQREFAGFDPDEPLLRHAKECGPVGHEFRHFLGAYDALPGVLLGVPDSLEEVVNQLSFDGGENRSFRQATVMKFDMPLCPAANLRVVSNHDKGMSSSVQLRE